MDPHPSIRTFREANDPLPHRTAANIIKRFERFKKTASWNFNFKRFICHYWMCLWQKYVIFPLPTSYFALFQYPRGRGGSVKIIPLSEECHAHHAHICTVLNHNVYCKNSTITSRFPRKESPLKKEHAEVDTQKYCNSAGVDSNRV